MLAVIVSLIFLAATSGDVVESLSDAAFAPVSNPLKITRVHYNPQEEEVYREYLYKDNDKIRIDLEYGNGEIYTVFVHDGKTGYIDGGAVVVYGIKLINGRRGRYVGFPTRKRVYRCPNCGVSNLLGSRTKYCRGCLTVLPTGVSGLFRSVVEINDLVLRNAVRDAFMKKYEEALQ